MAIESRGNRQYYYTASRVDGRVVKKYIGSGETGRLASEADQAARIIRRKLAELRDEQNRPVVELAGLIKEFGRLVDELVAHRLVSQGWHRHKRTWRPPSGRTRRRPRC